MSQTPPHQVLLDFLHRLSNIVDDYEESLVPVVRGSLLLRHWFGERGRPAADIDLECFEDLTRFDESDSEPVEGRFGRYGEFESKVDMGKAMCRYASQGLDAVLEFENIKVPDGEASLWTYGTPGERYFIGWRWGRERMEGVLQIDIAEPGSYALDEIGVEDIVFKSPFAAQRALIEREYRPWQQAYTDYENPFGADFEIPCYTQEMMLAAKLSWLVRGLVQPEGGGLAYRWTGEPKDLFDVHLLLSHGDIDKARFQKCMTAVCLEDNIDWGWLRAMTKLPDEPMDVSAFANWAAFAEQHTERLDGAEPWPMLRTIARHLGPLVT